MADDFTVTGCSPAAFGQVFEKNTQVVVVHDGRRGVAGGQGDEGPPGPAGQSVTVYGAWSAGQTYCPGAIVTDRSSIMPGVTSMYVQRSSAPCSASTTPPWQDAARWTEASAHDWTNAFGGIWEVYQLNHGFTMVGEPVAYSWQANRYVLASAGSADELGVAVVREVIDADRAILQSTGALPNIDPGVIYPGGQSWQPGRVYYVSLARGRLELAPPASSNAYANPILMPADATNGVALPWRPVQGTREFMPIGWSKFYFTATAGQTVLSGVDEDGNLLVYTVGPNTDVFVNGLNLRGDQFTATNTTSITLAAPLTAGDRIEVWTPDQPTDILVRSTTLKLDNIEALFDGARTRFPLAYGGTPVVFQDASSVQIWLDATAQEGMIDYLLVDDGGVFTIEFRSPPSAGTRFWGIALSPAGLSGLPPGGATGDVLAKASGADGDTLWLSVISGGTW